MIERSPSAAGRRVVTRSFWIDDAQTIELLPGTILPAEIGGKAQGLLRLPPAWVPDFVVVSPQLLADFSAIPAGGRSALIDRWVQKILNSLGSLGSQPVEELILRSNAVAETLESRGEFASGLTTRVRIRLDLVDLLSLLASQGSGSRIGLIVQNYVQPKARGHLSNERRVAKEYRDAIAQIEYVSSGKIEERRLSHRQWRRASHASQDALLCRDEADILAALREPLSFAAQSRQRIHFEWAWSGVAVYIVQADAEIPSGGGVDPRTKVRGRPESIEASRLCVFWSPTVAGTDDFRKLGNHLGYRSAGYWQPPFFILDSKDELEKALAGEPSDAFLSDLAELTRFPFILRTDYRGASLQMLPRSNQLTSAEQALQWFLAELEPKVEAENLDIGSLYLVGHHYIPSAAAAFSLARPGHEAVFVEALWGIPEGLYYHEHDRYVVHTRSTDFRDLRPGEHDRFTVDRDVRHKSHFVAPDERGRFSRFEVAPPWDWNPVIPDNADLYSIAEFTRVLAEESGKPINLMWFLECQAGDGDGSPVPWYHEKVEPEEPSTFEMNAHDEVVTIATESDLSQLELRETDDEPGSPALVVQLSPIEDAAIRDESFAKRVGGAAARLDALVVLNGASLSHIFYVLKRAGAKVCARSPTMATSSSEIHGKLVRDRIPEVVASSGEQVRLSTLAPAEFVAALKIKLVEEALEARDASSSELVGELADLQEVLNELADATGTGKADVEAARARKAETRGAFKDRVLLVGTRASSELPDAGNSSRTLERTPPLESAKRGPADVRRGDSFAEFIQTIDASITNQRWSLHSPDPIPVPARMGAQEISWRIEAQRVGPVLRMRLKIRIGNRQLELPLGLLNED